MAVTGDKTRVVKMTAAADEITGKRILQAIVWNKPSTAGHNLFIEDSAGNRILEFSGLANRSEFLLMCDLPVDGIKVHTIQSGTVLFYLA
jgi:hypothetical protein